MDAEARAFYAVGLAAILLGTFGLVLRGIGAKVPVLYGWLLLGLVGGGIVVIALAQRGLVARWRAWCASRPKSWPAGWKMEKR